MTLPTNFPDLKTFLKYTYIGVHSFKRSRSPKKVIKISLLTLTLCIGVILGSGYWFIFKDLPPLQKLTDVPLPQTTHIRDRNKNTLYKIYSNQNRTLIKLSDLPDHVINAFIAIEDKKFFSHQGFSPKGIARAAYINLKTFIFTCKLQLGNCAFTPVQGGSTITQQLVKTGLLSADQTFQRKIRELFLSIYIENRLSKNEILENYLNRIGFGGAMYGIEEAAQNYFGVPANQLTLAQAALLAGLPAAPTTYSPYGAHPEQAKSRQQEVLKNMVESGFISWEEAQKASSENLSFKNPVNNLQAPHFVMYVKDLLARKYGSQAVEEGGLDVTTTLDLDVQKQVEKIVETETAKVAYLHITNGAAVVTNPKTGEIIAMVGSRNYFDVENDGNVNVVLRPRQPGSSIKPLNYALGFQSWLTPASIIDDAPIVYKIPGQPDYSPTNYDHKFHGRVTARTALASSYNIPAVKVLEKNGIRQFIEFAKSLGITTWTDPDKYGLSLTLGGGEVTMLDLATSYGVFANLGQKVSLNPILEVKDSHGNILERHPCFEQLTSNQSVETCKGQPVLDPRIAYQITDILSDNNARAPTFGPTSQLYVPSRQIAVKTGTTNSLRDNWTIGYAPNLLVAVWVGNNDNSPMSYVASGVTGASPIWRKIIDSRLPSLPNISFTPPAGLEKSIVGCTKRPEYLIPGTTPQVICPTLSPTPQPPQAEAPRKKRPHWNRNELN